MKFAVIGVGKIGMYHIREFLKNNNKIVAILSLNNGENNKKKIKELFDININVYDNINTLFKYEKPDMIIISSPTNTHYKYLNYIIEKNVKYIFCEKPFIYNKNCDNLAISKTLFSNALHKNINLCVNTQWVYGINQLLPFIDNDINYISIYMEHHIDHNCLEFYTELISHMNSIIIFLLGDNKIDNIVIEKEENNYPINILFKYNKASIKYELGYPKKYDLQFIINNTKFKREVDEEYNQIFFIDNKKIKIQDPFNLSIKNFLDNKSLLTVNSILKNIEITDKILKNIEIIDKI
jgi:hypothetical protein